jgi:hypothetical protein
LVSCFLIELFKQERSIGFEAKRKKQTFKLFLFSDVFARTSPKERDEHRAIDPEVACSNPLVVLCDTSKRRFVVIDRVVLGFVSLHSPTVRPEKED